MWKCRIFLHLSILCDKGLVKEDYFVLIPGSYFSIKNVYVVGTHEYPQNTFLWRNGEDYLRIFIKYYT